MFYVFLWCFVKQHQNYAISFTITSRKAQRFGSNKTPKNQFETAILFKKQLVCQYFAFVKPFFISLHP